MDIEKRKEQIKNYLDEYIGRWSDISLEYTLFDSTDVYRVAYEMTKDLK